ncbi:MAG: DUF4377 domain-containing protein [Saprospiraceae bacterium]
MKFCKQHTSILFILIVIIFSCTDADNNIETILEVNHFKQSGTSLFNFQFIQIQEENEIGNEDWSLLFDGIVGFDYKLGFFYKLKVKKNFIENPPADGSTIEYRLIEIVSQTKVSSDTQFEILLSRTFDNTHFESFLTGNAQEGFDFLDQTEINCNDLCESLAKKLSDKEEVIGVFNHESDNVLKLIEIKNN